MIKALHDLCNTIDYAFGLSLGFIQLRMTHMHKPTTWKIIKKCVTIYKLLLKELSLVEQKVISDHRVMKIKKISEVASTINKFQNV